MSMFNNLTNEGLEEPQDRLGGFAPLETGIYTGEIKALYGGKSAGGATSLTVIVDFEVVNTGKPCMSLTVREKTSS